MKKYYFLLLILVIHCTNNKNEEKSHTNIWYEKATKYRNQEVLDSAFINYYEAKEEFSNNRDSIGIAKSFINMSVIMSKKGDLYGSIENALEARKFLNKKNGISRELLASTLNTLAISSKDLKNYREAIHYYREAISLTDKKDDRLAYLNNIGDTYIQLKEYDVAINYFLQAIKTRDSVDYARALNNLAYAKYLDNNKYSPVEDLERAYVIRAQKNDKWGLNSSFATLSDYYRKENDTQKALNYAYKMYRISQNLESPDDQIESLIKIILLEKPHVSQNVFKVYQRMNDSLQIERNKSKNQFAIIRYDVKKTQDEKRKLQKENRDQSYFILTLIGVFSTISFIGINYFKRRKQRFILESENQLKEQQLKTSKKVHDIVANGIYQVMTKIENQEHFDKEQTLDELEFVYEKSRDISYEKPTLILDNYKDKISNLISSFNNEETKIYTVGNETNIWNSLSESTQAELYQIIRELLINMKKHSKANIVVLKFQLKNEWMIVDYKDNGIGVTDALILKNGLSNTVSRIESIKGKFIFDTKSEKGFKVNISFPIS